MLGKLLASCVLTSNLTSNLLATDITSNLTTLVNSDHSNVRICGLSYGHLSRQCHCTAVNSSSSAPFNILIIDLESLSVKYCAFSALTLLVGRQEGHWPVKTEW